MWTRDRLYLLTLPGCPSCARVKRWLTPWAEAHPGVDVAIVDLTEDEDDAFGTSSILVPVFVLVSASGNRAEGPWIDTASDLDQFLADPAAWQAAIEKQGVDESADESAFAGEDLLRGGVSIAGDNVTEDTAPSPTAHFWRRSSGRIDRFEIVEEAEDERGSFFILRDGSVYRLAVLPPSRRRPNEWSLTLAQRVALDGKILRGFYSSINRARMDADDYGTNRFRGHD